MLIPLDFLIGKHSLNIKGVLHIGGHYGQEHEFYLMNNISNVIWFEPVKANYKQLVKNVSDKCYNIALGNFTGEVDMFIETANSGMSCSILEPGTHLDMYPHITFPTKESVKIDKLDNIDFSREDFNMISMDVQGYELEVLKGAKETLKHIDMIFLEVNRDDVYKKCARVEEIDQLLAEYGLFMVDVNWAGVTWGDAFYLKK